MTAGTAGPRYVIWVDFEYPPQRRAEFMQRLAANARDSLALEPGCLRFDILRPEDDAAGVSLYEIYESRQAFEAHLESRHYREFNAATAAMVTAKVVRRFFLSDPLQAPGGSS